MNLNEFAEKVAARENGKNQVNIAQIKEIINCVFDVIADEGHGGTELLNKLLLAAMNRQKEQK